jgi:hypothetical protein
MPDVAILPVQSNVDAAFARYVALEKQSDADPALLVLDWDRRC